MARVRGLVAVLVGGGVLAGGCGRVAFDPRNDAASLDAGAPPDASDPSLLLHVPFDVDLAEVAGGRAVSCAGGCPMVPVPGPRGGAAVFSGTACLPIVDGSGLTPAMLTLAVWVRPTSDVRQAFLSRPFNGAGSDLNSWELYEDGTGNTWFNARHGGGQRAALFPPIPLDTWHHLAATFDGATRHTYFDGIEVATETSPAIDYAVDMVTIGCDENTGVNDERMVGALDDVRVYDRVLTIAEIAALAALAEIAALAR